MSTSTLNSMLSQQQQLLKSGVAQNLPDGGLKIHQKIEQIKTLLLERQQNSEATLNVDLSREVESLRAHFSGPTAMAATPVWQPAPATFTLQQGASPGTVGENVPVSSDRAKPLPVFPPKVVPMGKAVLVPIPGAKPKPAATRPARPTPTPPPPDSSAGSSREIEVRVKRRRDEEKLDLFVIERSAKRPSVAELSRQLSKLATVETPSDASSAATGVTSPVAASSATTGG
eukprot:TRINITY_DN32811_c0_g1_i1.p1 TRINITY_DN32811_c0_g1~~TRINITY_DN32811_c0_g1_i1.p1  ORF type:complete len:230 (+),score=37.73 TRINITY_DN32811_c0_g1_i1:149-838(+)